MMILTFLTVRNHLLKKNFKAHLGMRMCMCMEKVCAKFLNKLYSFFWIVCCKNITCMRDSRHVHSTPLQN